MKDKTKNIKAKIKDETGLVLVEAAMVFPVIFFVLLFIIFIGNMYYEQARVDDIVLKYAIRGAECMADPFQYDMETNRKVPVEVKGLDIEPYRYIFGGLTEGNISKVEDSISEDVKNEILNTGLVFFDNTHANNISTDNAKIAKFHNYVVYSTFVVQVNYEVKFPVKFLGDNYPTIMELSSRAEVSVNDAPDFIRNVDMVGDMLEDTGIGQSMESVFNKINDFLTSLNNK